jgi:hypothetical protein
MWNGFFDLSSLTTGELRQLYTEAVTMAKSTRVDWLPPGSWAREEHPSLTVGEYIEYHINPSTHNVTIDRFAYNAGAEWAEKVGEIGSSTLSGESLYLFIWLELEDFYDLIDKWELPKRL